MQCIAQKDNEDEAHVDNIIIYLARYIELHVSNHVYHGYRINASGHLV